MAKLIELLRKRAADHGGDKLLEDAAAALEAAREESDRWQNRYRAAIDQARGIDPEAGQRAKCQR